MDGTGLLRGNSRRPVSASVRELLRRAAVRAGTRRPSRARWSGGWWSRWPVSPPPYALWLPTHGKHKGARSGGHEPALAERLGTLDSGSLALGTRGAASPSTRRFRLSRLLPGDPSRSWGSRPPRGSLTHKRATHTQALFGAPGPEQK